MSAIKIMDVVDDGWRFTRGGGDLDQATVLDVKLRIDVHRIDGI